MFLAQSQQSNSEEKLLTCKFLSTQSFGFDQIQVAWDLCAKQTSGQNVSLVCVVLSYLSFDICF